MKIKVIDDICGKGKTTYAINEMKKGIAEGKQYIYVTPFIKETERIQEEIPEMELPNKSDDSTKRGNLIRLLTRGANIATTHQLFKSLDTDIIELLQANDYTLIIDEVLDVIEQIPITKHDLDNICNNYITIETNNKVTWNDENYRGKYDEYKRYADNGNLYVFNDQKSNQTAGLFWQFPHDIFKYFNEVYIMTYLFDCQIMAMYFKSMGLTWQKYSLDNHQLSAYKYNKIDKSLFSILQGKKYNGAGERRTSLSKAWLLRHENGESLSTNAEIIKNKAYNVFRNGCLEWNIDKIKANDCIWTTYKAAFSRTKVYINGAKSSFLELNSRATNKYQHCHYIFYLCNLFFNPLMKQYFQQQDIEVNEDSWALSMLVQFVCRSAMRRGEKVYLYIPSKRMREMFMDYLM